MALIFVKKRREPIQISDDRAQLVKNRWMGASGSVKADMFETVDLGSWSGEYGQIASIEIESEKRADEWQESLEKIYTDAELAAFHKDMQKYRKDKKHWEEDRMIECYDDAAYLLDKNAVSFKKDVMHVVETEGKVAYQLYANKLDQWRNWRSRKVYGKRMRDKEFDDMVKSMAQSKIVHE